MIHILHTHIIFPFLHRYPLTLRTLITIPINIKNTTTSATSTHILFAFLYFSRTPCNALDLFYNLALAFSAFLLLRRLRMRPFIRSEGKRQPQERAPDVELTIV